MKRLDYLFNNSHNYKNNNKKYNNKKKYNYKINKNNSTIYKMKFNWV